MTRKLWIEHLLLRILGLTPGVYVFVLEVTPEGATWRVAGLGKEENSPLK